MSTTALVPVAEYLRANYEPDREYVEGQLVERNVGEHLHSRLQLLIAVAFHALEARHAVRTGVEHRLRVVSTPGAERFRVPDVCLMPWPAKLEHGVLTTPPLVVVEVLSPEDRLHEVMQKAGENLQLGAGRVYVADPYDRVLYEATPNGLEKRPGRKIEVHGIETLDLGPAFEEIGGGSVRSLVP